MMSNQSSDSAITDVLAAGCVTAIAGVAAHISTTTQTTSAGHASGFRVVQFRSSAPPSKLEDELLKVLKGKHVELESLKSCCRQVGCALEDVIFQGHDGGRILHVAVRVGTLEWLGALLTDDSIKAGLEDTDDKGRTAALVAVNCGRREELEELLRAGAKVNARDNNHYGVLHLLLESCMDTTDKGKKCKGKKCNDKKCENTKCKLKRLMDVADLLLPDDVVNTPASSWTPPDLESHAKFLDQEDATPLEAACSMLDEDESASWIPNIIELCKRMIKWGSNYAEIRDELEENGVHFDDMQRQSFQKNRSLEDRVIDEVCRGHSGDNLREELRESEDACRILNTRVGQHSLLFWAVEKSNLEMVRTLLEFGADPQVDDNQPIKTAAQNGSLCIFTLLLEGIKPSISQDDKDTIIKILSDAGTDAHNQCLTLIQDL